MVGDTVEGEGPATVRPDRRGHTDRRLQADELLPLLDVHLDLGPGADDLGVVPADAVRVRPGGTHRLGETHPVGIGERAGLLRSQRTGHELGAEAGHAETGAFLIHVVDDADRPGTDELPARLGCGEGIDGEETEQDAERTVPLPAVGDRVEVRSGDDSGVPVGRAPAPPGTDIAVGVGVDLHPAGGRLSGEPLAQGGVLRGPGVAAGAGGVDTDPVELRPHGAEGGQGGVWHIN